jgi:Uma2 family endonuclease
MAENVTVTPAEELLTAEDLERMGDIGRCELIDGRIVRMPPAGDDHGGVEVNFSTALKEFVRPRKLGKVRAGEVGIVTRRAPDRVRGADVLFISQERWQTRGRGRGFLDVAPELVVEVLSPDDRVSDMTQKLREYFAIGVKVVWVADPASRSVLAYRSLTDVREHAPDGVLTCEDVLPGFEVGVASLLED